MGWEELYGILCSLSFRSSEHSAVIFSSERKQAEAAEECTVFGSSAKPFLLLLKWRTSHSNASVGKAALEELPLKSFVIVASLSWY